MQAEAEGGKRAGTAHRSGGGCGGGAVRRERGGITVVMAAATKLGTHERRKGLMAGV